MDSSSRQKINKETWPYTTHYQMELIDKYRTFQPITPEYTFFSSVHRIFSMIHHILGHKTSLNKFKNTEIMSGISSDHNGMKLEINDKKKTVKNINI